MTSRRPFFLDWRYYACLLVSALVAISVVDILGLSDSNWRLALYFASGFVVSTVYEQWADWREATGRSAR